MATIIASGASRYVYEALAVQSLARFNKHVGDGGRRDSRPLREAIPVAEPSLVFLQQAAVFRCVWASCFDERMVFAGRPGL